MVGLTERLDHFLSHLAAAHAQTGSDRGDKVRRVRPELALHGSDPCTGRALQGSTPPGVHGSDGPTSLIRNQDRGTVRDPDRDDELRIIAEEDVGLRCGPRGLSAPPGNRHLRAVYLLHEPNRGRIGAQSGRHSLPFPGIASELQVTRREEMTGDVAERSALEGRTNRF
jgi:hypothetical protein